MTGRPDLSDATPVVFVTGAAGCIGRALMEHLAADGCRTVGMDLQPQPVGLRADAWVAADIYNEGSYSGKFVGVKTVFHLAAKVHSIPQTQEDADRFWMVNLEGTKKLIEVAARERVRKFVHVSTVGVLSPARNVHGGVYAESKRAAEKAVLDFQGQIDVIIVRPATVYGPYDKGNIYKLIKWIDRALPAVVGRGENRKSLVYVGNLAAALSFLSEYGNKGEAYVVTDGRDLSMREIVQKISQCLGKGSRVASIPIGALKTAAGVNERLSDWFGLPRFIAPDTIEKLAGETVFDPSSLFSLGFVPPYVFEQGMEKTVQWYKRSVRSRSA